MRKGCIHPCAIVILRSSAQGYQRSAARTQRRFVKLEYFNFIMDSLAQKSFCGVVSVLEEVLRSSDEEQQKDAEGCISDRDSTASSVDSVQEEMFLDGLDPVLDR